MYLPEHFALDDTQQIQQLIGDYPLASLIYQDQGELQAEHLPGVFLPEPRDGKARLFFHAAAGNRLAQLASSANASVLAIFQGPSGYVTPGWYEEKAISGEVVPTYNFAVVQVHGRLTRIDDEQVFLERLSLLSDHFENQRPQPWRVSDAPPEFIRGLLQAIVGLELEIERVTAKFKLSQNKSLINQHNIAEGLSQTGSQALSALMTQRLFRDGA